MDAETIKTIVNELQSLLTGRMAGKIFQLTASSVAIDFRLRDGRYLLINAEPSLARIHLIARRVRDLEMQSIAPSQFALQFHKELSGLAIQSVSKDNDDRIVRMRLAGDDHL